MQSFRSLLILIIKRVVVKRLIICLWCMLVSTVALAQLESGRIHAVIINGGMNKLMNHERYWNDCAFLYRVLRNDYHIPKRDITLLISDGGSPDDDMLRSDGGGFASSSSDIDGDGERDVWLPATFNMVSSTLLDLSRQLTVSDHLFLFLMDHGGSSDKQHDSFLYLWGGDKLTDTGLAALLNQFNVKSMSIVLGQCYSGGFIDNLERSGRVITTACRGDELSWSHPDKPFDSFAYHWICAIAGHDEKGVAVNADDNGDGWVTMDEAYRYACQHECRPETPQYSSISLSLGETWTFGKGGSDVRPVIVAHPANGPAYDLLGRRLPYKPYKSYMSITPKNNNSYEEPADYNLCPSCRPKGRSSDNQRR